MELKESQNLWALWTRRGRYWAAKCRRLCDGRSVLTVDPPFTRSRHRKDARPLPRLLGSPIDDRLLLLPGSDLKTSSACQP